MFRRFGIQVIYVDGRDPDQFLSAMDERVKVVYIETPANPTLCSVDIAAVAKSAISLRGVPLQPPGQDQAIRSNQNIHFIP
jgi:cystathionine beta-lyase/cystathionine gamma-synthase